METSLRPLMPGLQRGSDTIVAQDPMTGVDVFALWKLSVVKAIYGFAQAGAKANLESFSSPAAVTRRLGVAAVLPGSEIEYEDLVSLEQAGLLVVEVPPELESKEPSELEQYLRAQLGDVRATFDNPGAPAALSTDPSPDDYGPVQPPFDPTTEKQYLELLNARDTDEAW